MIAGGCATCEDPDAIPYEGDPVYTTWWGGDADTDPETDPDNGDGSPITEPWERLAAWIRGLEIIGEDPSCGCPTIAGVRVGWIVLALVVLLVLRG